MEYIIWGIPQGERDEQILYTKATTKQMAEAVCNALKAKHCCTGVRIQSLDMQANDVQKQFRRAVAV